jgi:DNA-binding GntR family transcriptional regulator
MGAIGDDHEVFMEAALAGRQEEAIALLARHIDDTAALVEEHFRPPESDTPKRIRGAARAAPGNRLLAP